ncbi:membrane protein [Arthrobacter phage Eileen]|uniref:Uncharacterized protein n=2 Tax=Bridgettevirus TaxID=2733170 RepID=A0A3G2KI97_9CAUD|nr:membrane protein [Arthrobacter phage Eileen]YP_009815576.1 membrane protein [Arthrobacter phage Peas]AYN57815.1 hypothetical protein PBI_EILEEN_26 [Arthrobacter phage Eileen]AYN58713.1 hypothetical protein PBI_PEAS_26 [Arthrobacter phage Peas]
MADHVALSTQERNPWSAVARTFAAILALIPIVNGLAALVIELLQPYQVYLPEWVFPALNGVLVATAVLAAFVTRVLARKDVNDWLRKYLPLLAPEDKAAR